MKSTLRNGLGLLVLLACLSPTAGHCYYNAGTGRWLSRDKAAENGGLNLYGFLNSDCIGRSDYLGLKFEDLGEKYIFALTGFKAITRSPAPKPRISYTCATVGRFCECLFTLEEFLVRTWSEIAVYTAAAMDSPPPYKPYTAAELGRNSTHEAKHRKHDGEWHDSALVGIARDFLVPAACGQCEGRKQEILAKWKGLWSQHMAAEEAYYGPDWTDADRKITPGEINEDPASWLWIMPVESLTEEISTPY